MTSKKNGTQQKKYYIMSFENNGSIQKGYMANTPPKMNKYGTQKNDTLQN